MNQIPQLLSVWQCAEALGVSTWTIRHLVRSRQLTGIHIGRRLLVEAAELQRFLEAHRKAATKSGHQNGSWRENRIAGIPDRE
jgi:excisionase family DNA binding protein